MVSREAVNKESALNERGEPLDQRRKVIRTILKMGSTEKCPANGTARKTKVAVETSCEKPEHRRDF